MPLDLPPQLHERVVCSIAAAAKYAIPANLVLAIAEQEGGKPGQWVRNTNGTHDVGALQFNTAYLKADLARYGITPADVAAAGCYPYDLAAWRLRGHIMKDAGDLWTRASNYHSRTPHYNAIYRAQLVRRAAKWGSWLEARFPTYDATRGVPALLAPAAPALIAKANASAMPAASSSAKTTVSVSPAASSVSTRLATLAARPTPAAIAAAPSRVELPPSMQRTASYTPRSITVSQQ